MRSVPTQTRILAAARYLLAFPDSVNVEDARERVRMREVLNKHGRMVKVCALREIARPSPSWPEIGALLGCSHSQAMTDWERWSAMPWRDRASWLDLIERVADVLSEREPAAVAAEGTDDDDSPRVRGSD